MLDALLDPHLLGLHSLAGKENGLVSLFMNTKREDDVREVHDFHLEHAHDSLTRDFVDFFRTSGAVIARISL